MSMSNLPILNKFSSNTSITVTDDPGNKTTEDRNKCFIYGEYRKTATDYLNLGFVGIPQNLILNVVVFVLLIILFSFLRKKAWNYGRIAFFHKREEERIKPGPADSEYDQDILYGGVRSESSKYSNSASEVRKRRRLQSVKTKLGRKAARGLGGSNEIFIDDHGYFRWIYTTFTLSDEEIEAKSGEDAVHYLSFQKHLIFIALFMTTTSVSIVIPLHFEGTGNEPNISLFQSGTIANLEVDNVQKDNGKLLWVHMWLAMVYMVVSVAVIRHFARGLAQTKQDPVISRTVMISRIAKRNYHPQKLESHFQEMYEDSRIEEISFAYDVSKLQTMVTYKSAATSARVHWENYLRANGRRGKMRPYVCGKLCCCCSLCGVKKLDALDYYTAEEVRLGKLVEIERKHALSCPLGIAFVTFESVDMAHEIVTEYRLRNKCSNPTSTTFSRKLNANQWDVQYAPLPEDLYWENLYLSYKAWYFKATLVNVVVILFVCIYSTPVYILNAMSASNFKVSEYIAEWSGKATAGLLTSSATSPMLLLVITSVLPGLISLSDEMVGFWTKTSENRARMVKTYTFLLFMTVILPSLGATSVLLIFRAFSSSSTEDDFDLNCIFYVQNGVFFVNYLITSAFIGMAMELLRLSELLCYAIKVSCTKSSAEMDSIRKSVVWDFQYGTQYAWTMLNFTMFVIFSLIYPIITPFGLVYLLTKYYTDRYNIYFAYAPAKVDKQVHVTAINFVVVSFFMLQLIMCLYVNITLKMNTTKPIEILKMFTLVVFCFNLAFFIVQILFNMCTTFAPPPVHYKHFESFSKTETGYRKPTFPINNADTNINSVPETDPVTSNKNSDSTDENGRQTKAGGGTGTGTGMEVAKVATYGTVNEAPGVGVYRKGVLENDTIGRYFPKILISDEDPAFGAENPFPPGVFMVDFGTDEQEDFSTGSSAHSIHSNYFTAPSSLTKIA